MSGVVGHVILQWKEWVCSLVETQMLDREAFGIAHIEYVIGTENTECSKVVESDMDMI